MSRMPAVSVAVPAYNYGRFLRQCIESVLTQTLTDWELIICDDCSGDDTPDIAVTYAARDQRIRYLRNEVRLGMNPNLKKTAEHARGAYIKMLCADDWLAPGCLEKMLALMETHTTVTLATSAELQTDEAGKPRFVTFLFGKPISIVSGDRMIGRMAAGSGFGGNSSFMIRSDAYRAVGGYDATVAYLGDYELAARLCRVGDYLHTDEPLFYGRRHPSASSSVDPRDLVDFSDYLRVADRFFFPRPLGSCNWRRYQRLTALITARGLINTLLHRIRGDSEYACRLWGLLMMAGRLRAAIPYLPFHAAYRLYARITGANRPAGIPIDTYQRGLAG